MLVRARKMIVMGLPCCCRHNRDIQVVGDILPSPISILSSKTCLGPDVCVFRFRLVCDTDLSSSSAYL